MSDPEEMSERLQLRLLRTMVRTAELSEREAAAKAKHAELMLEAARREFVKLFGVANIPADDNGRVGGEKEQHGKK